MISPYDGLKVEEWEAKTKHLIAQHPLDPNEIFDIVIKNFFKF